jgi:MutS domain V
MLVEHCGLNPMGNKAKAGCPIRNVQATLDCLTEQGFRVAVYEEAPDTDASAGAGAAGGSKSRIKSRFLAQIVSSASPTYLYDLLLSGNADALATAQLPARPYVGVLSLAAGYTLVEVSIEERSVRVSSRLTAEAVSARLAAFPPADPMFYVPSPIEYESLNGGAALSLPFLPSRRDISIDGPGARLRTKIIPPTLVPGVTANVDDVERAKTTIVSAILQVTENHEEEDLSSSPTTSKSKRRVSVNDFTLVSSQTMRCNIMKNSNAVATSPLHVETATQLGLMNDRAIPSLIAHILPNSAPAVTKRFLRRFLLTPPPPVVGDAMSVLVLCLKDQGPALPPLTVPSIGKILSLLRAGQASAQVYGELMQSMSSALLLLDELSYVNPKAVDALMTLLEYESGLAAEPSSLRKRCRVAVETIASVVSPIHHAQGVGACKCDVGDNNNAIHDRMSSFGNIIPQSFFERNEATWRGRVRPDSAAAAYRAVETAARRLAEAVALDFWIITGSPGADWATLSSEKKNPIVQDIFDNMIAIKQMPDGRSDKTEYKHPRDRFGKVLRNRYTTSRVEEALSNYVAACESAKRDIASALSDLSVRLHDERHIPAIVQSAHINLIVSAAFHHAARAATMGWNMARTCNEDEETDNPTENHLAALHLERLCPYWMNREESVANTIHMDGLFLLTAPNMSGKSTLMRSTAAAALLSVCGLCAPIGTGSFVKRFDHIFVRGASADVPSEQKSAFGAEMEDVASLLRSCGDKSLVFVDELGRGTSPRDGTRLAGAVLEALSMKGMNGIFATHLHDILALPLKGSDRIKTKRMAIHDELQDHMSVEGSIPYNWTYRLEDGVCRDSMALITAAKFGLPAEVLHRAETLGSYLPEAIANSSDDDSINGVASWPLNGAQEVNGDRNGLAMAMNSAEIAQSVLQDVTGQQLATIPAQWNVPPALAEGTSCVYMLQLDDHAEEQPRFYVGEVSSSRVRILGLFGCDDCSLPPLFLSQTDNLRQRIQQHRKKKGGGWKHASALVVQAPGKSQARTWESLVIRRLAQAGLCLVSISDGRRSM